MSIINVKDVSFSYEGGRVLENINISVERGEMVTIIGPNGGGKTTLLLLLLGLLKPDRGTILLDGKKPEVFRRKIGYVPQYSSFDPQFPVTVREVVLMGRMGRGFGFFSALDIKASEEALENVGLKESGKHPFSALSRGQRQRVLIARALAGNPEMLFLDEPTANIDSIIGVHLNELLKTLNRTMTILLVTHDMGFVANFTSRIFCVNKTLVEHPCGPAETGRGLDHLYGTGVTPVRHDQFCKGCDK